jgi:hypothetical protein
MVSLINIINFFLNVPVKSIIESLNKSGLPLSDFKSKVFKFYSVVKVFSFLINLREFIFSYLKFFNIFKGFYKFTFKFFKTIKDFSNRFR